MCDSDGPWAKNRVPRDENGNPVIRLTPPPRDIFTNAAGQVDLEQALINDDAPVLPPYGYKPTPLIS